MNMVHGLVTTAILYLEKAIMAVRATGLGYPSNTYVDSLVEATAKLQEFRSRWREAHAAPENALDLRSPREQPGKQTARGRC